VFFGISGKVDYVVSAFGERANTRFAQAQKLGLPVVSNAFVTDSLKGGCLVSPAKYLIVSSAQAADDEEETVQRYQIKQGAVVMEASGLGAEGHVLCEEETGDSYSAVLSQSDVFSGKNAFYKMQLVELDNLEGWFLFREWGRLGTTVGSSKLDPHPTREAAVRAFKALFQEKTKNHWRCRREGFAKKPRAYHPVDVELVSEKVLRLSTVVPGSNSVLPVPVRDLLKRVFDIEAMKETLVELDIDLSQMPLGKLSGGQLRQAFAALKTLQEEVSKDHPSRVRLTEASNRFYTLVPHNFGLKTPVLLDNTPLISEKLRLVDTLLDIEVATRILNIESEEDLHLDPVDVYYRKMATHIEVVPEEDPDHALITTYLANTQAVAQRFRLQASHIFRLRKEAEVINFQPYSGLSNRQLLWHGSRTSNFGGILSQGLRIAPEEAPATGYLFGKGLYFTDAASKAATYCRATARNKTGLLLLSEVALGEILELGPREVVTPLPPQYQSVKGCGTTAPGDCELLPGGLLVPCGPLTKTLQTESELVYNEMVVFNQDQARMRFLVQVDFVFT